MFLLLLFAFLAGLVTILSPCILPVLPVILAAGVGGDRNRPLGVIAGFVVSFTFFTLFLSTIARFSGIPPETFRHISIFILMICGLSMLVPRIQYEVERIIGKLGSFAPSNQNKSGFIGGVAIGCSLGLLWTPCVGPILASVISLAISGNVTYAAVFITLAYTTGTAIPLFVILQTGSGVFKKIPWLLRKTGLIQKIFGIVMIGTALGIFFNIDRSFQLFILQTFPRYGAGLTWIEDKKIVRDAIKSIQNSKVSTTEVLDSDQSLAPEIIPGGEWINSSPLSLRQLKGKVVLIDFWTYSCINCQRTLPYLKSWWAKYKKNGLVIIGVHSPEFAFEKDAGNVAQAVKDFGIEYPVVQDNDFATWRAYDNQYWPAKYLIDAHGVIRYSHFGEGGYDVTEEKIQELLAQTNQKQIKVEINNPTYEIQAKTPETYLGYSRISGFVSKESIVPDTMKLYSTPATLGENEIAYQGEWEVSKEYAHPKKGATLFMDFNAKEVYLVMRPNRGTSSVKVYVDGKAQYAGADVKNGAITIDKDRLYHVVSLPVPGEHLLKIQSVDGAVELYAFTFG